MNVMLLEALTDLSFCQDGGALPQPRGAAPAALAALALGAPGLRGEPRWGRLS